MNVNEFKRLVISMDHAELVEDVLLCDGAEHVTPDQLSLIKNTIIQRYMLNVDMVSVYVVGSAKLGFSIVEKQRENVVLPRYRPYSFYGSDVDIAVVSEELFTKIWKDISNYVYRDLAFPYKFNKIGSYLTGGWLRPDCFPKSGLLKCDLWWEIFNYLSTHHALGRRKVRGGLYFSREQLNAYQQRAIRDCRTELMEVT